MRYSQTETSNIKDSIGLFCAIIKISVFTRYITKLSGTRQLANVYIHVKRAIGNVRQKYSLLSACQPIHFLSTNSN